MTLIEGAAAVIGGICSVIGGLIIYIFRVSIGRIDNLEIELKKKVNKEDLDTLLNLRLSPLTEDIQEIKDLLQSLLEIKIQRKRKKVRRRR